MKSSFGMNRRALLSALTALPIIRRQLCLVIFYTLSKKANMLSLKSLFAFAVLVPLLGAESQQRRRRRQNPTPLRHVLNVLGKPMKLWLLRALVLISAIRTPWDRMPIASAASKQALGPNLRLSSLSLR